MFSFTFYSGCSSDISFDSAQWKSAPLYGINDIRYRMHNNLLKKHKLIGMPKEEIVKLLGPQSDPSYFQSWDLRYWMGPEPGFISLDSIWIIMKLKDNKVIKYEIVTD